MSVKEREREREREREVGMHLGSSEEQASCGRSVSGMHLAATQYDRAVAGGCKCPIVLLTFTRPLPPPICIVATRKH
jgi:hypothetical protein